MEITVTSRTVAGTSAAVGSAGQRTVTVDRPIAAGGGDLGFSGGELLFLAIAACYHNDVFREAAKLGIEVRSVQIEVRGSFAGRPVRARNIEYTVDIDADATARQIDRLIATTDRVAEIHNTLRHGTEVRLTNRARD